MGTLNEAGKKMLAQVQHLPDVAMKAGLAYIGYRATGNFGGSIAALVGLELAKGNNLAGGAAGVTALTGIGLLSSFKDVEWPGLSPTLPDASTGTLVWMPSAKACTDAGGIVQGVNPVGGDCHCLVG